MKRSTTLPHDLHSARTARAWVLEETSALDLRPDRREELSLLVSELVTNVVQHTDSEPVVTLQAEPGRLVVGVADSSTKAVRVRQDESEVLGGWGLRLVEQIADSWGTRHLDDGAKVIWFAFDLGT